jgi:hypothetical protein
MYLLLVVGSFTDRMCLPHPGVLRSPQWFGTLLVGIILAAAGVPSGRLVAAELSIPTEVSHSKGSVMNVSVGYSGQGAAVAALQFDLQYDRSVLNITATAGGATTGAGKSLSTHVLPNGQTRFLIAGLNQNVIADGSVVDLTIQVSTKASMGPYPLAFFNALGVEPTSQPVSMRTHNGRIIIAGPP